MGTLILLGGAILTSSNDLGSIRLTPSCFPLLKHDKLGEKVHLDSLGGSLISLEFLEVAVFQLGVK